MSKVSRALLVLLFSIVLTLCVSAAETEQPDLPVTTHIPDTNTFIDVDKINGNDFSTSTTLPDGLAIEPFSLSISTMLDTNESSVTSPLSKTTPMHLPESNGASESVRNAFSHTGVGFCVLLAALMILYGIITTRRRRR